MQNQLANIASSKTLTMSSREIAELIGKEHSNLKISAERLSEKCVIGTLAVQEFVHKGNTYTEYLFSKRDSLILVAQNCPEFTAAIVDRWQELEAAANMVVPNFNNPALAARAWADQYEARLLAEDKTAKLEVQLDINKSFASIKKMEKQHPKLKFDWRKLKATCNNLELEILDVFDQNYGTVKAYPAEAWLSAYGLEI